jgi:hypothetical protein
LNQHRPAPLALLPAALCLAFAVSSCSGLPAPASPATETQSTAPASLPPASTSPVPATPSSDASPSTTPTTDGGSAASGLATFSGTREDVQFSFDHPSGWTVQDTTAGSAPDAGVVEVLGPDGTSLASLTVLIAWGAECPCVERPAFHLGDVAGEAPLSKSGPFVVRSMAVDLTDYPQDRAENNWPDNVRVVTSLSSTTAPAPPALVPRLMYGLGLVETGVVASNGISYRTILFISSRDFHTAGEAQAYGDSDEHRKIQAMIASFREGTA